MVAAQAIGNLTMASQKGREFLLKVYDSGSGTFTTVAVLRAGSIAFNAETVDVTRSEPTGRWREILAGAGEKRAQVRGDGIFKDVASNALTSSYISAGSILPWQIVIADFCVVQGPFQVTAFEISGRHDGEVAFEIALESAGEFVFTAI